MLDLNQRSVVSETTGITRLPQCPRDANAEKLWSRTTCARKRAPALLGKDDGGNRSLTAGFAAQPPPCDRRRESVRRMFSRPHLARILGRNPFSCVCAHGCSSGCNESAVSRKIRKIAPRGNDPRRHRFRADAAQPVLGAVWWEPSPFEPDPRIRGAGVEPALELTPPGISAQCLNRSTIRVCKKREQRDLNPQYSGLTVRRFTW